MEKCNDVLFLDIDGVLSRAEYGKDLLEDTYGDYCLALHRPSVEALRKLLLKIPTLKIVWISDWAKHERGECNRLNCYIDPLQALEMFPWIKVRVIGDIFGGPHSYSGISSNVSKLNAIESYVAYNNVQRYAVIDDYDYGKSDTALANNSHVLEHIVQINPLKSLLEDDLPRIEKALWHVSSVNDIYDMLLNAKVGDIFKVNNTMKCTVDKAAGGLKEDSNCPRQYVDIEVSVADISTGQDLAGLIMLSYDKDVSKKGASLYTKSSKALASYQSYVNIVSATPIMQEEYR